MTVCPVCLSRETPHFQDVDEYTFHRCNECGFVFLDPMPDETVLESIYNDDGSITPEYYPKAKSRYWRASRTAYHLLPYAWGGDVLDVGCGGGFQVWGFRRYGIEASGLDISADSISYARRNNKNAVFYCEEFSEFLKRKNKYDFIYSSEVIEHVVDLDEFMVFLSRCLNIGGYVFITTPDIGSDLVPAEITEWDVFNPPRHVQFFCADNLTRVFDRYGFEKVKRFRGPKAGLRILFRKN